MGLKKKIIISLVFALVAGAAGGYYASQKNQPEKEACTPDDNGNKKVSAKPAQDLEKINLKLDLLKDYTDFVLLPLEKISDPAKYADDMGEKVKEISDDEITSKYYATGETDGKEQKILDFLDFLNSSVKNDLQ